MNVFNKMLAPLAVAGMLTGTSCEKEEIDITIYPYTDSLYTALSSDYRDLQAQNDSLQNVITKQQNEIDFNTIRLNEIVSTLTDHLDEVSWWETAEGHNNLDMIAPADKAVYYWCVAHDFIDDNPIEDFEGNEPITREKCFAIINHFATEYHYTPYEWNGKYTQVPVSYAQMYTVVSRMLWLVENETNDEWTPYRAPHVEALMKAWIGIVNNTSIYDQATGFDFLRLLQKVWGYHTSQI